MVMVQPRSFPTFWKVCRLPRREDGGSGGGVDLFAIYFKQVLALNHIPPLVLVAMAMQRRTFQRRRTPLEDGKCAVGIAA